MKAWSVVGTTSEDPNTWAYLPAEIKVTETEIDLFSYLLDTTVPLVRAMKVLRDEMPGLSITQAKVLVQALRWMNDHRPIPIDVNVAFDQYVSRIHGPAE